MAPIKCAIKVQCTTSVQNQKKTAQIRDGIVGMIPAQCNAMRLTGPITNHAVFVDGES
jgi:hypothetical protein